jgi:glycosyltransferase involved in cell wall biosynthesis
MADVHVFADGDETPADTPKARALPPHDKAIGGYEQKVLVLGNSEFHAGALKLLRVNREDAVVQAHDAKLAGLYLHGEARGAVPEGVPAVVATLYPYPEQKGDTKAALQEAEEHGALMDREVVALAREVLATSAQAAEMIRQDCAPADKGKVAVWDFAYPPPVDRDPHEVEEGLICSFGLINPLKAPDTIVRSFADINQRVSGSRLAFVGPISDDLKGELCELAESIGVGDRTTFTGNIPDAAYQSWLRRACIALQLRVASNGETSAAVADCLSHGIPVVVTALGPQARLPDFIPKVDPAVSPAGLALVVETLLGDESERREFAARSKQFVSGRSFEQAARWFIDRIS